MKDTSSLNTKLLDTSDMIDDRYVTKNIINHINHIMVIDDDEGIRNMLSEFLRLQGYVVSNAANTKEADVLMQQFVFDAIVIDVMMDGESGLSYLKRQRKKLKMPVIMLTALDGVDDRINGLETGADDYLAKPFSPKELLLRIEKLLMRHNKNKSHSTHSSFDTNPGELNEIRVRFGDFLFNPYTGILTKNGANVYLTNTESKLLSILGKRAGTMITREQLVMFLEKSEQINIIDNEGETHKKVEHGKENRTILSSRTVDTQIARLRQKIETVSKKPEFLQTIRGTGYVLWATII
jgi:two-component system, OmpR family, phosphate regulon response regulator OmpR